MGISLRLCGDSLLSRDHRHLAYACLDLLLVGNGRSDALVEAYLIQLGNLHNALKSKLLHQSRNDLFLIFFL
jgi:hypothetical protein